MSTKAGGNAVADLIDAWAALFQESAQMSIDLLRAMAPGASGLTRVGAARSSTPQHAHACSCTIPPACWLPVDAGDVATSACPGATATMRITVANCGATPREVALSVAGSPAGVTVEPGMLNLGPLEDGTSLVSFAVPADAADGREFSFRIWVRGCKTHFVGWTITAGDGDCRCRTVRIEDCPDTIHHWYDHFYCLHPCQH